jgi:hypothetical protein
MRMGRNRGRWIGEKGIGKEDGLGRRGLGRKEEEEEYWEGRGRYQKCIKEEQKRNDRTEE